MPWMPYLNPTERELLRRKHNVCPYCGEDPCQTPMACNEAAVLEQHEPLEEDNECPQQD
jgi:hypothetical protein